MVARARRGRTHRVTAGRIAVLGCAVIALAAIPAGAQVLTTVSVVEPGGGAAVTGPRVVVDVRGLGQAEAAQARITAAGQTRTVDLAGPQGLAGGSRWSGTLDLGGLPNGPARVEGRARFAGASSMTDWTGHDVRLDVPPPAISLHVAPVAGHPDAVALSWTAAGVPDLSGYEVQRALAGGGYETLLTAGAGQHAHTDVGVPPGEHRYRVRAIRPSGSGGSKPGPWAEGVAIMAPPPTVAGADGGPGSQGPTSGVAARPPTGGISARLRAGTEDMSLPDMAAPAPQVAPRDLIAPPSGADGTPGEEVALGAGRSLAIEHDGAAGLSGDAVRLVALVLVALLALRAHRITHRPVPAAAGPLRVRLSAGPDPGGTEAWRTNRAWSRGPAS